MIETAIVWRLSRGGTRAVLVRGHHDLWPWQLHALGAEHLAGLPLQMPGRLDADTALARADAVLEALETRRVALALADLRLREAVTSALAAAGAPDTVPTPVLDPNDVDTPPAGFPAR